MPWPESWPIRGEDVAFADPTTTIKEAAEGRLHIGGGAADVESFMVVVGAANTTS